MSQPGIDPWGVAAAPAAPADPWGTAGDEPFGEDEAKGALNLAATGAQVTSQKRSQADNARVGGVPNSMHLSGQAMDFVLPHGADQAAVRAELERQGYPITEWLIEKKGDPHSTGDHIHWGWGAKGAAPAAASNANVDPWGVAPTAATPPTALRGETAAGLPTNSPSSPSKAAAVAAPEASWADILSPNMDSMWDRLKNAGVGLADWAFNELYPEVSPAERASPKFKMTPGQQAALGKIRGEVLPWFDKAQTDIQADLKANMPNVDPGSAKSYAYQTLAGVSDMVPALAVLYTTKNPEAAAAIMGGTAAGEKYSDALAHGRTRDEAGTDAAFSGMVNGTMGLVPLNVLMKPGGTFLGQTLRNAGAFGVQNIATEALQIGYDKGLVTPNMTLKEAWGRIEQAGIVGTLTGAFFGAGHAGFEQAVNRFRAQPTPPQPRAEPTFGTPNAAPGTSGENPLGIEVHGKEAFSAPEGMSPEDAERLGYKSNIAASAQADIGLTTPGRPPEPDPWAPAPDQARPFRTTPANIADEHALEVARLEREAADAAARSTPPARPPTDEFTAFLNRQGVIPGEGSEAPVPPSKTYPRDETELAKDEFWGASKPPPPIEINGEPLTFPQKPEPRAALPEGEGIPRRALEADTAITASGREVPVRYAVVEASHLVPSQTQEGSPNSNYPQELQPRDRTRAVSQAQIASIAQNINPRLLGPSVSAADGAPIISASGIVESGNGRTLAIQRAYGGDMASAQAYRDHLAREGYPVEGMTAPVLVRIREGEMTPEDRQAFVREANQSAQLGHSATERAMTDAAAMPEHVLDLYRGGDVDSVANRDFVRTFMRTAIPANEHAGMIDQHGGMSAQATQRVRAALLAKAYGDPDMVARIIESPDDSIKAIGGALGDVAADWARMRARANEGSIPESLDQTPKLLEAVNLVRRARDEGHKLFDLLAQRDIFSGDPVDPDVEAWLRLMFRNTKDWTKPVGREKLADALRFYATEAQKAQVGPDLLGNKPVEAGDVLATARARQEAAYAPAAETRPSLLAREDVRARGGYGEGPGPEGAEAPGSPGLAEDRAQGPVRNGYGPVVHGFRFEEPAGPTDRNQPLIRDLDEFFQKSSASAKDIHSAVGALANYILGRGRQYGVESIGAWSPDGGGKIYASTTNDKTFVSFGGLDEFLRQPQSRLVTLHNHPSGTAPSFMDFGSLGLPGHAVMAVVPHTGGWHAHRLVARFDPSADTDARIARITGIAKAADDAILPILQDAINRRVLAPDTAWLLHRRIANEAMDRAGVTEYLSSDHLEDESNQPLIRQALKASIAAAKGMADANGLRIELAPRTDGVYRPAEPLRFADGVAKLLGRPAENAGQPAGIAGAGTGAGLSRAPYRKPEQLRLLEDAERYAETPEFKRWFSGSKIVDEAGTALVVYHGTPSSGITEFLPSNGNRLRGVHFSTDAEDAREWGARRGEPASVQAVYLKIKNPADDETVDSAIRYLRTRLKRDPTPEETTRALVRQGYDGFRDQSNSSDADELVAFRPEQIKSAIGNRGTFDPNDPNILREDENRYERERPIFYSALTRAIDESKMSRAPAKDWLGFIDNLQSKGVKSEEVDWSGIREWLKGETGPVTREKVLDHLRANEVRVQEVIKGGVSRDETVPDEIATKEHGAKWEHLASQFRDLNTNIAHARVTPALRDAMAGLEGSRDRVLGQMNQIHDQMVDETYARNLASGATSGQDTKFSDYALPGGDNYRELLLTLPPKDTVTREKTKNPQGWGGGPNEDEGFVERGNTGADYRSGHWNEPNVLAHIRFDTREGPDGEKILHISEIQSDWGQRLRRTGPRMSAEELQTGLRQLSDQRMRLAMDGKAIDTPEVRDVDRQTQELKDRFSRSAEAPPPMPFKASWHELAMKRVLRYAAESGSRAWHEATKPESAWEKAQHILGSELASVAPLKVMDVPMLEGLKNDQIRRAVVQSIPVDVVDVLSSKGFTPDQFTREPDVVSHTLSIDERATVARGFARALELVGARERAALLRVLVIDAGRRHGESGTAVGALQMDPRVVLGLLAPDRIYGRDGGEPLSGSGRASVATKLPVSGLNDAGVRGKLTTAQLADALNRHDAILTGSSSDATSRYIPGYERISWDSGSTQADRYDLSKQVDAVKTEHFPSGEYRIDLVKDGHIIGNDTMPKDKVADYVGKDLAKKIVEDHEAHGPKQRTYSGLDLRVGGEGMKGFYDRILPQFLSKYVKKWGAKVGKSKIAAGDGEKPYVVRDDENNVVGRFSSRLDAQHFVEEGTGGEAMRFEPSEADVHSVDITPAMRESVMGGQALFEDENRYKDMFATEPGAVDAKGRAIPQTVIPGAEKSAAQLAKAREAAGHGLKTTKAAQKEAGPLFGPGEGAGGGGQGSLFETPSPFVSARPLANLGRTLREGAANAMDLVHDAQMLLAPMAEGSSVARATAKTFANMIRLGRWHGQRMDELLKKGFTPAQRRKMWEAADQESVARQQGQPTAGIGLSTLTPEERRAVLEQQQDAQNVWKAAQDLGMVSSEGLPSYVPRMMVEVADTGVRQLGSGPDSLRSIPGIGRNLRTKTSQMLRRRHLTSEETEAAGSAKFDTAANIVKDIRTLPLATARLREAVAGRALINKIKEIGRATGDDTVVEGNDPSRGNDRWFHLNHPSFFTWRPKFIRDPETGEYVVQKDQNGDAVLEKTPLWVRGDFEGPLKAVLTQDQGRIYNALMNLKGKAMTTIMYSPLIHNAVEWGRALPAMPGKVLTMRVYFEGNAAKRNPETMTEAITHGLVPIGHQGGYQDITSIATADNIRAGRSWTAKALGAIPGLFDPRAKEAVYRAIDRMGDIWHNTLLWDRVGDLQMGLYTNLRDQMVNKGYAPDTAQYVAAHFANRYAGALPQEAMSTMSRKLANLMLFSRTYTLGNLGAMKDVFTGLPRDVQAQIEQSGGDLNKVKSLARRKALGILVTDIALFYAANSLLQSGIAYISKQKDLSEIEKGYVDRLMAEGHRIGDNPLELLNPFGMVQNLSATSENEQGREDRVLVGTDHNGTAIYARNPVGKIGEEFKNWLTQPLDTFKKKLGTLARPTYEVLTNDAGFGRHVYDPNAKGASGLAQNVGRIVSTYLSAQVPLDSLKSAYSLATGKGGEIDTYKTLGPLAGVTFSKGALGGPAVGYAYQLEREHQAKVQAGMPDVIEKIKGGDIQGARADMKALGVSPGLANWYVRTTLNPKLKMNTRKMREMLRSATPEERARLQELRGATP